MTVRMVDMKRLGRWYALLAMLWGCRDSTAPPTPCQGAIDVTITSTPNAPVGFHWLPACGISSLSVTTVEASPTNERAVWGWTVSEQFPVGPSVVYGVNPRGATVWMEAESLDLGTEYRVTVMYTVGGDVMVASGTRSFTVSFLPD